MIARHMEIVCNFHVRTVRETCTDFVHFHLGQNTEMRSYRFYPVDHEDALLQETDESVKLRNASGPGQAMGSGSGNTP
jgi:hypothetical protein